MLPTNLFYFSINLGIFKFQTSVRKIIQYDYRSDILTKHFKGLIKSTMPPEYNTL